MSRGTRVSPYSLHPISRLLIGSLFLGALYLTCIPECSAGSTSEPPKALLDGGRIDDAVRLLAPLATGNNGEAYNYLGRAYFALGDWDNAVRNCERAAQAAPTNATFQLWLGRSYGEKANVASTFSAFPLARKTVAAFIAAHNLERQNVAVARDLGEYYASAPAIVGGGNDKALALANEIAATHPADADWIRALVASSQGNYPQAEAEYAKSIRDSHESAGAYIEFARYLRGRKQWDRFQQQLDLAIKSAHIQASDRYDAAELLLGANRNLSDAAQQMRTYIQSGHTDEEAPLFRAHFLLGEILLRSGDSNQAAAEYRAALALASSYRPAADALHRLEKR